MQEKHVDCIRLCPEISQPRIICIYRCFKQAKFSLLATYLAGKQEGRHILGFYQLPTSTDCWRVISNQTALGMHAMHAMHAFLRPDPNFKTSQVRSLQLKLDWSKWIISASKGKIQQKKCETTSHFQIISNCPALVRQIAIFVQHPTI